MLDVAIELHVVLQTCETVGSPKRTSCRAGCPALKNEQKVPSFNVFKPYVLDTCS